MFSGLLSQDFQTGTTYIQKSNAGERISKLFVEKKIFYSLVFLLADRIKMQRDFFA